MPTIIKVENLSKKYLISHKKHERYIAIRDVVTNKVKDFFFKNREFYPAREELWALQNISFEVKQGDRIGIIGRNGAGKSTLLKILSRITEPTKGRISIKGRITSLLEVGTGFHPELTGRENIFLNGAILGMSKFEIKNKFDEIVAFAEVEKFLDTPVKHYSSGMYVRLAFAVAAHLESEILLIDEVLAVGDVQFQKKCLGKMGDITSEGRTVLFVSHNMNAIEQFCNICIMLDRGNLKLYSTDLHSAIKQYLFNEEGEKQPKEWLNNGKEFDNPWFKPLRFAITDGDGKNIIMPVSNNSDFFVTVEGEIDEIDNDLTIGYAIYSEEGDLLYWSYQTDVPEDERPKLKNGRCVLKSRIPKRFLNEGIYKLEFIGGLHYRAWLSEPDVKAPSIYLSIKGELSDSSYWIIKRPGIIAPIMKWTSE